MAIITFSTESERLSHFPANRIPEALWSEVFENYLSTEELGLLRGEVLKPKKGLTIEESPITKLRLWLCILLSHSESSQLELAKIAKNMKLPLKIYFKSAILTQRLDLLNTKEFYNPEIREAIVENYFWLFRTATALGYLNSLNMMRAIVPELWLDMLLAKGFRALVAATRNGHLDILSYFKQISDTHWSEIIAQVDMVEIFCEAAANGHIHILNWLKQEVPSRWSEMIDSNRGFILAAQNGRLDVLQWFDQEAPDKVAVMIESEQFSASVGAIKNGHIAIVKWLEQKMPHLFIDRLFFLSGKEVDALCGAASRGHRDILAWFIEHVPAAQRHSLQCFMFGVLRSAHQNNQQEVIQYLLPIPEVFEGVVNHHKEFNTECTAPFVTQKLAELHRLVEQAQLNNPNVPFNLSDEDEIKLCIHIITNCIIRKDEPACLENIRFLLNIPAIYACVHEGESLRSAIGGRNQAAAKILLDIPAVRELAEKYNYFIRDVHDLRELPEITPLMVSIKLYNGAFMLGLSDPTLSFTIFNALDLISKNTVCLDLSDIKLNSLCAMEEGLGELNEANIGSMIPKYPQFETVYFRHSEVEKMSPLQHKILIHLFPNIKRPVFIDDQGNALGTTFKEGKKVGGGLITSLNYAREIGFEVLPLPSLQEQAAFFAKQSKLPIHDLPETVQNIIKKS